MHRGALAALTAFVFLWAAGLAIVLTTATARATVTSQTRSVTYTGSGGSTFTVTFPFTEKAQIKVTKTTIATGVATILTQGTDYTVRLPVGTTSGVVTTTATISSSFTITIERVVPLTQNTSFIQQGPYRAADHEAAFDKLTMITQQIQAAAGTDGTTAVNTHVAQSDPHTQYALLAGRSGGQTLIGGTAASNNLWLKSTSNGTTGALKFGSSGNELYIDDVNDQVGIGTSVPTYTLELASGGTFRAGDSFVTGVAGLRDIHKLTDVSVLNISGSTTGANETGASGIKIYGTSHATCAACLDIYAAPLSLYDATGNLRWTLTSAGVMQGTSGTVIQVNGSSSGLYLDSNSTLYGNGSASGNLTLSSTKTGTKGKINLGSAATSAYDELNGRLGVGTASPSHTLEVIGPIAGAQPYAAAGASASPSITTDCGTIYIDSTANAVINLPAISTASGCEFTLVNGAASGTACVQFNPDVGSGDGIQGTVGAVTMTGVAGTHVANTSATAVKGDYLRVVNLEANLWYIIGGVGIWKAAACP